jgi:hypothetical protein
VADDRFTSSSSVQRVVVTSSVAAITRPVDHQTTLSEKDWNEISTQEVESKGKDAAGIHKYRASKTLAERGEPNMLSKPPYLFPHFSRVGLRRDAQERHQVGPHGC